MDLAAAMADPNLLGPHFEGESYAPILTLAKCLSGRPLSDYSAQELELVRECAGCSPPEAPPREFFGIMGRRSGKTKLGAAAVVQRAALVDYAGVLSRGERGVAMLIATDRRQARVAFGYIRSMFADSPLLAQLVADETREAIHLRNGISVEVHTASFRRIRGYSVICACLDELAFWPTEDAAEPDHEILNALRPATALVPTSLILGLSSPHSRRGVLWNAFDASPLPRAVA